MTHLQPGLCLGGKMNVRAVELCIPSVFVEDAPLMGYWRPEFVSDYYSNRRLAVTRHLNWLINNVATQASLKRLEETTRLAEGDVVLWQDPAPIEKWILASVSVSPINQARAALGNWRSVPYCGRYWEPLDQG